jgi:hypothetical protein
MTHRVPRKLLKRQADDAHDAPYIEGNARTHARRSRASNGKGVICVICVICVMCVMPRPSRFPPKTDPPPDPTTRPPLQPSRSFAMQHQSGHQPTGDIGRDALLRHLVENHHTPNLVLDQGTEGPLTCAQLGAGEKWAIDLRTVRGWRKVGCYPRLPASISGSEIAERLAAIDLNQGRFARRRGMSWWAVHNYQSGVVPMPATVFGLLQFEELLFGLNAVLPQLSPKARRLIEPLLRAASPPVTKPKKEKKRRRLGRKRNLFSPQYLPVPVASLQGDELEQPATWQQLASRVGPDAAAELHRKLAGRRPAGPRRHPADGDPPPSRNSDPI